MDLALILRHAAGAQPSTSGSIYRTYHNADISYDSLKTSKAL
jgi:hypothetical protein